MDKWRDESTPHVARIANAVSYHHCDLKHAKRFFPRERQAYCDARCNIVRNQKEQAASIDLRKATVYTAYYPQYRHWIMSLKAVDA